MARVIQRRLSSGQGTLTPPPVAACSPVLLSLTSSLGEHSREERLSLQMLWHVVIAVAALSSAVSQRWKGSFWDGSFANTFTPSA